ncbi:hypothetical protein VN1186_01170 [Helicobacter pylori]|nr:hypothetical protein VN1186_01170 [Helicobacter pylori]
MRLKNGLNFLSKITLIRMQVLGNKNKKNLIRILLNPSENLFFFDFADFAQSLVKNSHFDTQRAYMRSQNTQNIL